MSELEYLSNLFFRFFKIIKKNEITKILAKITKNRIVFGYYKSTYIDIIKNFFWETLLFPVGVWQLIQTHLGQVIIIMKRLNLRK